jgi:hypothetical protein
MAADLSISQAVAKAMCDTLVDAIDAGSPPGTIAIRSGTRPATTDTAVTGTLLATLTFSNPAFGAATTASPSVATASAITSDSSADNTGTATWFRIFTGSGTAIADGNVGTSGEDLNLNTVSIVAGAVVSISAGTISMPVT